MALTSKDSIVGTNHGQHRTKYDFEEMVADIIDNSIDANATEIHIEFEDTDYTAAGSPGGQGKSVKYKEGLGFLTGNRSYLLISDNGKGMTFGELHENLTRGSIREYEDYELGHFGIGLKDATLSQAYEVTIFSKKKGHPVAICGCHRSGIKKQAKMSLWSRIKTSSTSMNGWQNRRISKIC